MWESMKIDRAVVFGHSLNEMDYDYFNYLFTLLKFHTLDIEKMGSIEFVNNIYDSSRMNEIRNRQAEKIYNLFDYYEDYVGGKFTTYINKSPEIFRKAKDSRAVLGKHYRIN